MGKRGPKPVPTETKKRRGSWRGSQNPREPLPDPAPPKRPSWLKGDARACWDELSGQLHRMGTLTSVDGHTLALYCTTWALWRACEKTIAKYGPTVDEYATDGETVKATRIAPEARMLPQLVGKLISLGSLLGLSPSARVGMVARVPHREDEELDEPDERVEEARQPKITGPGRFFVGERPGSKEAPEKPTARSPGTAAAPMREIVKRHKGKAGRVVLVLSCGHRRSVAKSSAPKKRSRCASCKGSS